MENKEEKPLAVRESRVEFRAVSDRTVYTIYNDDINQAMVEISGYDLCIDFNMEHLRSVDNINAACDGIAQLFKELIMDKLLEYKRAN
jgi:hypothetical protein